MRKTKGGDKKKEKQTGAHRRKHRKVEKKDN